MRGPSRNRGIEAARGEYLSFVGPDDYVSSNFYALLYAAAMGDGGHDIAKGMRIGVGPLGEQSAELGKYTNGEINSRFSKRPLYRLFTGDHWTALYRRSLFEDGTVRYGTSKKVGGHHLYAAGLSQNRGYRYRFQCPILLRNPPHGLIHQPARRTTVRL